MEKKSKRSSNKVVIIAVSAVIFLLIAAVIAAIFLPPVIEKSKFSKLTERILSGDAEMIVLSDPVGKDKYGNLSESEVCLYPDTDEYIEFTRLWAACRDADFDYQYSAVAGIWDITARAEYQSGEFDILYFTESGFVRADGQNAFFHSPDDPDAYAVFYSYMVGILNTQN